ncbi:MAG TPA: hypothetical protein VFG42_22740 [Baekduia sp.]|uniref:hypothetical protein n=1 Tax=Baekduia sp. TaxID=2600305 RepID=UPI002D7669E8|nr:hypothetical protein [Baekduia sp.]HET6509633.1 hypothetical protein [Baekduia sp.]
MAADHQRSVPVFGPFCRLEAPKGQDANTVVLQVLSGEIWGEEARAGDGPTVQAYARPLRAGERGIEFWAFQAPDTLFGPRPSWRTPGSHLVIESEGGREVAKLRVAFVRVSQDLLHASTAL